MKTVLLCLFLSSVMPSCKKTGLFQDDELYLSKQYYTGNKLRIDGYYYFNYTNNSTEYVDVYFLFKNGIILSGGSGLQSELPEKEERFQNGTFDNKAKSIKFLWGVHQIEGSKIAFERWYPSEKPYRAYVSEGVVLNDTTFRITQSYRNKKGEKTEIESENEVYHFKQFSPKPDSTNTFIK
jgi:hypothetical protein